MEDKYIKIPNEYLNLFPISIDNMRVELLTGEDDHRYIADKCLVWTEFLDKFDSDLARKEELMPLYTYVLNSNAVSTQLKKEILENL